MSVDNVNYQNPTQGSIPPDSFGANNPLGTSKRDDFGPFKINKKGFIEIIGEVVESLPSITFRVKLENGQEILARLSGKMRLNKIMLIPGDKVKVEISPYDLTKGRIMYRL